MTVCGGILLLSLFLGDIPTILAAAKVFGFMPIEVDKGEGTASINVNPVRLLDIAYSIHEKSSKFLKEHRKEPEKTTSQPDAEITAHSAKSPYGYNSTKNNDNIEKSTFSPAESYSNIGNSSHTSLNSSTGGKENAYNSSIQHDSSNKVGADFEDYGDRRNEGVIGYSQCSKESGNVNCKYVSENKISEKHVVTSETNSSLTDSNVHKHTNYSNVSNKTIQNGSDAELLASVGISKNNKKANNGTNIRLNSTAVFDTENPVHEKSSKATITKTAEAPKSVVTEKQYPARKDDISSLLKYETLLKSSKTDSHSLSDYPLIRKPYLSDISHQAYDMPLRNSPARNMCFKCGPNAYCDTTKDPQVCVCHIGYRGNPPDCYQPSEDDMLSYYSMLLHRNSKEKTTSANSLSAVNSKEQFTKTVLQKNKGSASPKL